MLRDSDGLRTASPGRSRVRRCSEGRAWRVHLCQVDPAFDPVGRTRPAAHGLTSCRASPCTATSSAKWFRGGHGGRRRNRRYKWSVGDFRGGRTRAAHRPVSSDPSPYRPWSGCPAAGAARAQRRLQRREILACGMRSRPAPPGPRPGVRLTTSIPFARARSATRRGRLCRRRTGGSRTIPAGVAAPRATSHNATAAAWPVPSRQLPRASGGEGQGGEAGGFGGGDAEHAQHGLGKLVNGGLCRRVRGGAGAFATARAGRRPRR